MSQVGLAQVAAAASATASGTALTGAQVLTNDPDAAAQSSAQAGSSAQVRWCLSQFIAFSNIALLHMKHDVPSASQLAIATDLHVYLFQCPYLDVWPG